MDDSTQWVRYERQGALALITLNRPEKLNAVTPAMHQVIADSFRRFEADEEARVVVLRGEGRGFCAGRDLKAQALSGRSPTEGVDPSINAYGLPDVSKFVITAARGAAVGVGGYMFLAGDVRVASGSLHFALTEVPTAVLGPYWLQQSEMLPPAVAFRLTMGDRLSADELKHWGLLTDLVEDADLEAATQKRVEWLLSLPPRHAVATKAMMKQQGYRTTPQMAENEREVRAQLDALKDTREAAAAFMERRPPRFTGA